MKRVLKSAAKVLHFFAVCWASTPKKRTLPAPPLKGGNPKSPFKGDLEGLARVRRRLRLLKIRPPVIIGHV